MFTLFFCPNRGWWGQVVINNSIGTNTIHNEELDLSFRSQSAFDSQERGENGWGTAIGKKSIGILVPRTQMR